MTTRAAALAGGLAVALAWPAAARAQSLTAEVAITAGASTERVDAGAMQARLIAATKSGWRVMLEGAFGRTRGPESDAFAAAYPYNGQIHAMETYVEKMFRPGRALLGVRAGRYRTPFGISSGSDHAYNGFLRPPMIRYGELWALSNQFLEAGVDVLAGVPAFHVETSVGRPSDQTPANYRRPNGLDVVVHAESYFHSLIVGASTMRSRPSMSGPFVAGNMVFHGVDARWMRGGVLVRGEWLSGRPFDGVRTTGGYLDVLVHRLGMGPVTAVTRIERLDYFAGPYSSFPRRLTAGAKVRFTPVLTGQLNVVRAIGAAAAGRRTQLDAGLTCTLRF